MRTSYDFQVEHNRRAQMQLYVFARKSLRPFIKAVERDGENTGFMSIVANKVNL